MKSYSLSLLGISCCLSISSLFGVNFRTEPWLTESAISFLDQYLSLHPEAIILEFGSGASTLWFAERTPHLHSVEHSDRYYAYVSRRLKKDEKYHHVEYYLLPCPYYGICDQFPDEYFDLILVDGRNRKGCIAQSIAKLKTGGVLMLDNAERPYYFAAFEWMEEWEHISTEQTGPDKFGFWYPGWRTDWWVKPQGS